MTIGERDGDGGARGRRAARRAWNTALEDRARALDEESDELAPADEAGEPLDEDPMT